MGEQWLTISSNTGVRRLDDPGVSMRNKGASLSGKFYLAALDLLFLSYGFGIFLELAHGKNDAAV